LARPPGGSGADHATAAGVSAIMAAARSVTGGPVGRAPELVAVEDFLGQDGTSRGLVLTGEAGVRKARLWVAAIDVARRRGMRVVSTRASGAEARLAFAGL